ncbi:hypothetical protein ISF_07432 [Cordyceps fumosorosea ARSEF 2679]|uniref:Uncharacterized protein n=1 Tax=Cordyceps fumosorosea (strain ARSEF 2679) TaxID=1081104 RepID=A0A167PQA3_CORFA|nr:hypothetical protein ISF_07432 [Cordyceps fumosorosea ARSEF 2679]OAA56916.1 hypothetical protein ISF_07432 [Cordyceps fumosorosea ARSEF 2679]
MEDLQPKTEPTAERKAVGYKSWKKKYRKMRIVFDQKMQSGEALHKQEAKTSATVKRLAVENDRLLDILLDINNSAQIPLDKRIDVALIPAGDVKTPSLAIDRERASEKAAALKKLEELLTAVPHINYNTAKTANSAIVEDLTVASGESHPVSFLTADDVDDYIFTVDSALETVAHLPSLAPRAHPNSHLSSHPHLKNPTSVTNWLRKHAPKVFLQDGEAHDDADAPGGGAATADGGSAGGHGNGPSARKSRGGRGERGGKPSARGKRASGVSSSRTSNATAAAAAGPDKSDKGDADGSMDEDPDYGTPVGRGKRKRKDDAGYRPGGSASRPSKKKRKSDVDTPSGRRVKKEVAE